MSRKRGKKQKAVVEAVPDDILAEGSGPAAGAAADAITTAEDVVTTADIATTEDVITADDVVATARAEDPDDEAANAEDPELEARRLAVDGTPPQDSDIVTAAELAEAMEAATAEDGERHLDGELGDGELGDGDLDGALDGEGGGGDGDDEDDDAAIVFPTSAAGMDAVQLKHLVEALIFASDRPLTVQRLRQLTRVSDVRRLEQALEAIITDYQERGLILQQVSGGYQFRTRTQFSAWVQQLIAGRPVRLSRAQLETLAIIAYRQPITRPEIDDIRGVDSSATLKLLLDRMLIRVLGKREEVGRPMLYGTTKEFLDFFSLGDLRELPTLREYSELTAESRKVMSDRLGLNPDGSDSSGGSGGGGSDGGGGSGGGSSGDGGGGSDGGGAGSADAGDDHASDLSREDGEDAGTPAHVATDAPDDAMAAFLSAAEAVDRSDADALAEPGSDAETFDVFDSAETSESDGDEDALEAHTSAADAVETVESEAVEVEAEAVEAEGAAVAEHEGRVEDNEGWPEGSQRIAVADQTPMPVIAPSDHRPVERPVMDPNVIGAGAPDDNLGDAAPAASHREPAAE